MSIGRRSRVAVYGYFGIGNIGNEASLSAFAGWVRQSRPHWDLACWSVRPEVVRRLHALEGPRLMSGRSGAGTVGRTLARLADLPRTARLVRSTDAIVVPGMGVLEETLGTRPWGLPYWLALVVGWGRLLRRPVLLLSIGAEVPENRVTHALWRFTLNYAAYVSYRDQLSADAARSISGRTVGGSVVPDLAFLLAAPEATVEPGRIVVGVMAYYGASDDREEGAGIHESYCASLVEIVTALVAGGHTVRLVIGDDVDAEVIRQILVTVGHPQVQVSDARTFDDLLVELAHAEVVVASRYHNLIAALIAGRPAISLSYAEKNRVLLASFGLGRCAHPIEAIEPRKVVAQVEELRADSAQLGAQIRKEVLDRRQRVRSQLDSLPGRLDVLPHTVSLGSAREHAERL